ncbi:MAG: hypothetical protein ACK5P6_08305 [Pseudobdellovibrionaceae bacterium]
MKNFFTPLKTLVTLLIFSTHPVHAQFEVNLQKQSLEAELRTPSGRSLRYSSLSGWNSQSPSPREILTLNEIGALEKWTFTYNREGNLISAKSPLKDFVFSYNSLGQLTELKDSTGCRITLRSQSKKKGRRLITETQSEKLCQKNIPLKRTEIYYYKQVTDSSDWILEKIVATLAKQQVIFEISSESGEITSWTTAQINAEKLR